MEAISCEDLWWGEEETPANEKVNVDGLEEKADHIEKCISTLLTAASSLPLGLVAEWSQRASYSRRKVVEATGGCMAEHKRQIKTAEERRAQADRRRIVRDECARCGLSFGRPETARSRQLWRLEVRSRAEEPDEAEEAGDQRLVAVCEGCEQVHMVGRMPRLRGEKRQRTASEQDEEGWDAKSTVSLGAASTATTSAFGSEQKRKGSVSSLCSTPSQVSASPLVVSAAAKKSAKKKRGSELSRLLRENETAKKDEGAGGLAAFLASLS